MSSDYGDFCRAQRTRKQQQKSDAFVRNVRELHRLIGCTHGLVADARDYGHTIRLTMGAAVVDYWPSTGTTRVVSGKRKGDQRIMRDADHAVKWLSQLAQ